MHKFNVEEQFFQRNLNETNQKSYVNHSKKHEKLSQ